jgi:quercetin dioxygenase-like cupin family protein
VVGESIGLVRLTFWPGATLEARTNPGMHILYVESGRLGYRLVSGTAWITRITPASTGAGMIDGATSREFVTPGELVLRAGDSLFAEAGVVSAAWNMSETPTLVTIATLIQPTQPIAPIAPIR